MSKYKVESVVCDYGVFEDNELKLICNSQANALKIKEILETDADMSKPYVWQDKRIAELEEDLNNSEQKCLICNKEQENEQLRAKLKELPKQLVEKIKEELQKRYWGVSEEIIEILDTILKDYEGDNNK